MAASQPGDRPLRVAVTTLGCRLNQYDGDALERLALERGWQVVPPGAEADVHVVNGCTITHDADSDSRQAVRRIAREQPDARIFVTGCYADSQPEEASALPGVFRVAGNTAKAVLFDDLDAPNAPSMVPLGALTARARAASALVPHLSPRRSRAFLKIQDGCDYKCSFCIVPAVRGASVSLAADTLVERTRTLVRAGAPEVVLTGVHLGTYGRDLEPRAGLIDLLGVLIPAAGPSRLRLGSLDPHEVDDSLIDLMATHPETLCRHLHLPVQSCDPEILKRMRRAHTADQFVDRVNALAERIPGVGIGADVIVGFPGESDDAFERTLNTLESLPLSYLHVFSYSDRQGTEAAKFGDKVPKAVRKSRNRALRDVAKRKGQLFAEANVGKSLDVVFHRTRHRGTGQLVGIADNYLRVLVTGPDELLGTRRNVQVREAAAGLTHGDLV